MPERVVRVEHARELDDVLAALADDGADAVCVGRWVADPLGVAQRVARVDREVAVVVVASAERCRELEQERLFTPFLGPDVSFADADADPAPAVAAAAERTRDRRRHRETLRAASAGLGRLEPSPASPARSFGRILDRAPIGVVTTHPDGRIRGWNRRAEALFGVGPGVEAPAVFAEHFPPAVRPSLVEHLALQIDPRQEADPAVFERTAADGAPQVLEIGATSLPDEPGGPAVLILVQDVTARVTAERRRREVEALLTAVVASVPDAIYVKDRDGRYLLVNTPAAAVWGRAPDEVLGRLVEEVVHADSLAQIRDDDRLVLETGRAHTFEEHVVGPPPRWFSSTKAPFHDHEGRLAGLVGISRDITERKRAEARARRLAEATAALAESLDLDVTVHRLAHLGAEGLADACVVALAEPGGRLGAVATAAARPEHRAAADALARMAPAALRGEAPQDAGLRETLVLPLRGTARAVGVMLLGFVDGGRAVDDEDRRTAAELADRAAIAIENARAHAERSRVATTLQRSLLPPRLPRIPGTEIAVRFRAAGEGIEVGGDFYDVFPIDTGWALAIGDVRGKGPEAAAVTALARYTIRALALGERRPDRILRGLNDALLQQRGGREFCTASLLRLDLVGGGAALAVAGGGHPPPLVLRADGTGAEAGAPGTLLGAIEDPLVPVGEAVLGPGDSVVLYTDGLTEARAPERLYDTTDLLAAVAPVARAGADAIAAALADLVPTAVDTRDDIAIVVLSLDP